MYAFAVWSSIVHINSTLVIAHKLMSAVFLLHVVKEFVCASTLEHLLV